MAKKNLIITIAIVVAVGLLGFYGGIQHQKSQRGNFSAGGRFTGAANQQTGTERQGTGTRFTPVSGEITSIDNNTITIKTQDGSSKIVIYSTSTKVNKTSEGSKSDIKVGEKVMVLGTEGSDKTVTATNISVGNTMLQGPAGGQPGQNGQPPSTKTQ